MVKFADRWVAVWTRSRHEKFVRDQLTGRDIEAFLPLLELPSKRKDRRKTVHRPAFPGYLFAKLNANESLAVRETRGVVGIVGPTKTQHSTIPEAQVEHVRRMVESELRIDPYPYLKVGSEVRIKKGPLFGLKGHLVEKRSRLRLVIVVDLLQQGLCAEVSADDVETA